jgi:poly(glycerol-phosphate) alpha-glucosyltransferase
LQAWFLTRPEQHNWQLVIAGETKDQQYVHALKHAAFKLNIADTVKFIGGQFGQDKDTCYREADAFILSSFSEGLPIAVLEAWSYKLPVLMTACCNLPEGFARKAALKVEPEAESVANGIQSLLAMPEKERQEMGENGFDLVKTNFSWQQVAASTLQLYKWVLGQAEKPDFVML